MRRRQRNGHRVEKRKRNEEEEEMISKGPRRRIKTEQKNKTKV